jgi:hypothetical protein
VVTDDETLDKVVALYREADALIDEADVLETEAANKTRMAEDKEEEAERLWKPLLTAHPDWLDALMDGKDPR